MPNRLLIIMICAAIARILFYIYGAPIYFGTENFTVQGDTYGWKDSILNLIHSGIYTSDPASANGWFYRPPGYSFFIGIIYILCGFDIDTAFRVIPWIQIGLDTCCVFFVHRISLKVFSNRFAGEAAAVLYAFYPYIIVWNPVIYAECLSVFLMLWSLYFFAGSQKGHYIYSGILLGLAVLTRLQVIFIFPFMVLALILFRNGSFRNSAIFAVSFLFIYGLWPARNFLNHDRLVFSQDLNVGKNWSKDYLSFMEYVFSIQTDHQPQFDQIVYYKEVTWPPVSYLVEGDSAILADAVTLCRQCGRGFSEFMNFRGQRNQLYADSLNCDAAIEERFKLLTEHQKEFNRFHYYVTVPLKNLEKCIFKVFLYGNKPYIVKLMGAALFMARTFLILFGIAALIFIIRKKQFNAFCFIISGFFVVWYIYLSFIYRNIEIRYLLHTDLLLLIPAAYLVSQLRLRMRLKGNLNK